eukprot:CAMPEP_0181106880 /NCGR_PEP_ID=MMETSP1071-20121207/16765_1 /TAXON_ID=35127 /ORGANISM="Thalassiosira sp., Strain NH16" /LENGTH=226 /DNA_ID=CAMNT_0023190311 /DNA_START=157 /DNA_END=834 /DNA_ORIENTATION=-
MTCAADAAGSKLPPNDESKSGPLRLRKLSADPEAFEMELSMPSPDIGVDNANSEHKNDESKNDLGLGLGNWWINFAVSTGADIAGVQSTYAGHEEFCENQGKRLCKLQELCPHRPTSTLLEYYAYTPGLTSPPGFTVPAGIANIDNWVAYNTDDISRQDNCNVYGGCPDNGWVQIGKWSPAPGGGGGTCDTHCELAPPLFGTGRACPSWGASVGGYSPVAIVCCAW